MCGALNTNLQLASGGLYLCCFMEDVDCIILYVKPVCDWVTHSLIWDGQTI